MTTTKWEYVCDYWEKNVEEDSYEHGCNPKTRCCTGSSRCYIAGGTLPELIKNIGDHLGLDIDDVFIPDPDQNAVTHIGYNRMENAEGFPPNDWENEEFERGVRILWLADYTFAICRQLTEPVQLAEFDLAGIKNH